jgi:hypothetical protein
MMVATGGNFYLNQLHNGKEELFIYGSYWPIQGMPELLTHIPFQSTRWTVKLDGIFSFASNETHTFLTKKSSDATQMLWNTTLPHCGGSSDLFVTSCYPNTYAFCGPQNIVTQISSTFNGKIMNVFSVDEGQVLAIECSETNLFVLYSDSRVMQYSSQSDYVHTYLVPNKMVLPQYNQLKASNGYLFYALCNYSVDKNICLEPTIYQWAVKQSFPQTTLHFSSSSISDNDSDIYSEEFPSNFTFNSVTIKSFSETLLKQNSYFNAVSYKRGQSTIIVYFSGAGNIQRSTIGDTFIIEIVISNEDTPLRPIISRQFPVKSSSIRPLSRYAANIFQSDNIIFLLIHGGISSDFNVVCSKVFSLDLSTGKYETLNQKKEFS